MKKYLVAVSGGVDSVVLLDMLAKRNPEQLVVAHFDHGIRTDSADDALFVKLLTASYGIPFVTRREELGEDSSEELARARRYAFLEDEAKRHEAVIVTAHHKNDLIETMAINVYRGTGWRGLAVFGNAAVYRPLLHMTKDDLYEYALKNRLEWVEDSTNRSPKYLRNRMRARLRSLPLGAEKRLETLWRTQYELRSAIDQEVASFTKDEAYSRYFFTNNYAETASEILRGVLLKETGKAVQRPQVGRALLAIKTAKPSTILQLGEGISLRFTTNSFVVVSPQKVI